MTLTFDLLTPKSNFYLGEISMKSMSGQDFANAGQIDRHTEGLTDGQCVP